MGRIRVDHLGFVAVNPDVAEHDVQRTVAGELRGAVMPRGGIQAQCDGARGGAIDGQGHQARLKLIALVAVQTQLSSREAAVVDGGLAE
ncbi:hypothetical protein D3C86_2101240 [compost metagenome]